MGVFDERKEVKKQGKRGQTKRGQRRQQEVQQCTSESWTRTQPPAAVHQTEAVQETKATSWSTALQDAIGREVDQPAGTGRQAEQHGIPWQTRPCHSWHDEPKLC